MIGRGLLLLAVLPNCVLSLPVTSSQLESEDVEVMKCIVEALADVLSRPKYVPISQECLNTLKTDEKLLSILRHHNFLKELQEIAAQGDQRRAQLQKYTNKPTPITEALHTTADGADRSMLDALGGPGERSILSQKKRAGGSTEEKEESQDEHLKRDEEESQTEAGHEENGASLEEHSEEENEIEDKKGELSAKKRDPSRENPKQRVVETENEEKSYERTKDEKQQQKGLKRGNRESVNLTQRGKTSLRKKEAGGEEMPQLGSQQEMSHHSKEEVEEGQQKQKRHPKRSPEERELQMIAQRSPEERKLMEEEGSGSRKSEEPEIESLAAIESELENVAQKLHQLRRG